jgi:hypothetical protein
MVPRNIKRWFIFVPEVPGVQPSILKSVLNERGEQGWELVQLSFGKDGIMAFWKRFVT